MAHLEDSMHLHYYIRENNTCVQQTKELRGVHSYCDCVLTVVLHSFLFVHLLTVLKEL